MHIHGKRMSEHKNKSKKFKRKYPNRISGENWLFKVKMVVI